MASDSLREVPKVANLISLNGSYSLSRALLLYRWVWLLDDSIHTISHDLYSNTIWYNEKSDWSSFTESFEIYYVMMSFESLSNVCVPRYCNPIACRFNGNLQRKHQEYTWRKPPYDTLYWAARRPSENHWKSVCLKFCLASIFPVSQPQGWELLNKKRRLTS